MSEPEMAYYTVHTVTPPAQPRIARFWLRNLPYIALLALTLFGVAYTSVSHQPPTLYWEFLTVTTGLFCVTMGWLHTSESEARFRLVWTQALHWLAYFVVMNLVLLPAVQKMLAGPAAGLALLMLLALGTFDSGLHISWQIGVLGLIMAFCVQAMALLV
jgi:hypothetical protein